LRLVDRGGGLMRVTGGEAAGRRLRSGRGKSLRPTMDRVREGLFAMLGPGIAGAAMLDVFAGSGGVGVEALSRGAASVVFIERDPRHAEWIRRNLDATGFSPRGRILVTGWLQGLKLLEAEGALFDCAFADPPYEAGLGGKCLARLADSKLLKP